MIKSGNKISVKTLDLNKEFTDIAKQLDKIVVDNFELDEFYLDIMNIYSDIFIALKKK